MLTDNLHSRDGEYPLSYSNTETEELEVIHQQKVRLFGFQYFIYGSIHIFVSIDI